ncbi:MAG: SDR family oxidoreductase [Lacunisphaera sp.]|nr:SDR family oxidoreductase [Lacunisphaera sp.]
MDKPQKPPQPQPTSPHRLQRWTEKVGPITFPMTIKELMNLDGRTALVTGGYGIYGAPISEALAEAGAHVIIASRSIKPCAAFAAKLRERGWKADAESFDQSSESSILQLRDRLIKQFSAVPILVNNSVGRTMRGFDDSLEAWHQSMQVNADGFFAISRAFIEPMMAAGQGSIVNISSIQGVVAPDFSNYAGTNKTTPPDYHFHKHGMIGLTKYLAAYSGPRGVRVNAISPGGFQTDDHQEPFLSQYCRRVFLGRMARHDDIKGAVVFLASDASGYITGQNIVVDGGYTV